MLRNILKKILRAMPPPMRRAVVRLREWRWRLAMKKWESTHYGSLPKIKRRPGPIKNILIYHISGLTHAGTEKNLQLIANSLASDYKVCFMYGEVTAEESRRATLDKSITLVPFFYEKNEIPTPHKLSGMRPHIKEVIREYDIDLIVTASPGYAHYPWNIITEIPIVTLDIFGAPTLQENVERIIHISHAMLEHATIWTGFSPERDKLLYSPLAALPPENTLELGRNLRNRIGIKSTDFVFGRIGRNDDTIFDPIGIRAWQKIADQHPNAHYLIMSPPPVLEKIVELEHIPRVHFLPPSGKEEDVWAFHGAIDCFAHFRRDGETSGVAIAESLAAGNPIITHRSHFWNAHLEYLAPECVRIAPLDDVTQYARHMEEYLHMRSYDSVQWESRKDASRRIGIENFSPVRYKGKIIEIIKGIE